MKSEEVATAKTSIKPQKPKILINKHTRKKTIPSHVDAPTNEANALLVAIDTPYQIFDNQKTYVHVAAWHVDGKPAKSARVHVGEFQVGETNEHSSLVFLYPPKGSGGKSALNTNIITIINTQNKNLQNSIKFSPNIHTTSFTSNHLFIYTDRGVYKPGDTISMRAIN